MYCPVCDERILGPEAIPEYRSFKPIDYGQAPPALVGILDAPEEGPEDSEREAETLASLFELQPWYLRTGPIVLFLFCLTPLGLLLMWAQRPRRPLLGGTWHRLMISLCFGGAWLGAVVFLDLQVDLPQLLQRWSRAAVSRLDGPAAPAAPVVTLAMFNRLQEGDPEDTVIALLGPGGSLTSRTRLEGVAGVIPVLETAVYEWHNPDGSSVEVVLQNGILAKKKQYGLERTGSLAIGGGRGGADAH